MRSLILAGAILLADCGAAPTAPSPPPPAPLTPSLAGSWTGSYFVRLDGDAGRTTVMVASLTQDAARQVTGTWSGSRTTHRGTITGQIAGTGPTAQFAGTFTLDAPSEDPAIRCLGTAQIAGSIDPVRWTAARVVLEPTCSGDLTDLIITLTR